jgi:hypothetical protein
MWYIKTNRCTWVDSSKLTDKVKGKAIPLQALTGPEGSRRLRLLYFKTAYEGGKVVSNTHRPPLPPEILLLLISVGG